MHLKFILSINAIPPKSREKGKRHGPVNSMVKMWPKVTTIRQNIWSIYFFKGICFHVTNFCINSKTTAQKIALLSPVKKNVLLDPMNQLNKTMGEVASLLNMESCSKSLFLVNSLPHHRRSYQLSTGDGQHLKMSFILFSNNQEILSAC